MSATTTTRAGDRERQATAATLGQALAENLDMTEYEQRVRLAFSAQTTGELGRLLDDLPAHQLRLRDPRRHAARQAAARMSIRLHAAAYLMMVVVVLVVWLTVGLSAGAWYFWPVWPILGAGIGLAAHTVPVRWAIRPSR
jgi:hypothetical protein